MGHRLSKIYTRTGDDGTTSVTPHERLPKDAPLIETLGTLDELNSAIGWVLACRPTQNSVIDCLTGVQQDLFNAGGELCPPHHPAISADKVTQLEKTLDAWNETLPPLKEFIMPGGNIQSAACHLARTICRRAERSLVTLKREMAFNPEILHYINRLSDVLFVAARLLAKETGSEEILWEHERQ